MRLATEKKLICQIKIGNYKCAIKQHVTQLMYSRAILVGFCQVKWHR